MAGIFVEVAKGGCQLLNMMNIHFVKFVEKLIVVAKSRARTGKYVSVCVASFVVSSASDGDDSVLAIVNSKISQVAAAFENKLEIVMSVIRLSNADFFSSL